MLKVALKGAGWALLAAMLAAFAAGAMFGFPGLFAHARPAPPGLEAALAAVVFFWMTIVSGIPLIVAGIGAAIAVYLARRRERNAENARGEPRG